MPDLIQRLGFDAKQAIEEITALNQALMALNAMLGDTGSAIQKWNSVGSVAVTQFTNIKTAADAARKAIDELTAAQAKATTGATKASTGPTASPLAAPRANFDQYRDQIQQLGVDLGKVPASVSQSSQRAYASAASSLADFATKNKISMQDLTNAWLNPQAVVSGAANTLANKCQQVKNAHAQMVESGKGSLNSFSISWETFARVIQTQVIVRSIYAVIAAFQEGVIAAIDFGKRVAEIGTILGKPFAVTQGDLKKVEEDVLSLSKTYGMSIKDVAEGYYQVLSNQVGNTSESMYVLEAAMKFGIATNSSATASIDLLTATLNGYKLGTDQAAEASGVLFRAVELGRFHASDLANILGRVGPVAHEMGVSLEETMAALTTMTVTGVRADTAVTQLRGVFTQMLKPTKELKELMQQKWGVENAQEAIAAFGGLVPLLAALDKEANGNVTSMSEFFKNVRALTGVLQTTGDNTGKLTGDLAKLNASGAGVLNWAKNLVMDTDAKRAEIAITRLKDSFVELGTRSLPLLTNLVTALTACADILVKIAQWAALSAIVAALPLVASGITAVMTGTMGLTAKVNGLTVAFSKMWPYMAALIAFELTNYVQSRIAGPDREKDLKERLKAVDDLSNKETEFRAQRERAEQGMYATLKTEGAQYFAVIEKLSAGSTAKATGHFGAYASVVKRTLQDVVKTTEAELSHLENAIANHTKNQEAITRQGADITSQYEDRKFSLSISRMDEASQAAAKGARAETTLADARSKMSQATSKEELDLIKTRLDAAQKLAESQTDARTKMGFKETGPSRTEQDVYQAQLDLTKRRHAAEQQSLESAKASLPGVIKKYERIKELQKEIEDGLKAAANSESIGEWKKKLTELQSPMKELAKLTGVGLIDFKTAKITGMQDLNERLKATSLRLDPLIIQAKIEFKGIKENLSVGLSAIPKEARAGYDVQSARELGAAYQKDMTELARLKEELSGLSDVMTRIQRQAVEGSITFEGLKIPDRLAGLPKGEQEVLAKYWEKPIADEKEFNALLGKIQTSLKADNWATGGGLKVYEGLVKDAKAFSDVHPEMARQIAEVVKRMEQVRSAEINVQQGKPDFAPIVKQVEDLEKKTAPLTKHIEDAVKAGKVDPQLKNFFDLFNQNKKNTGDTATNLSNTAVSLSNAVKPAQDLAAALQAAADASASIDYSAAYASTGGLMHLAGGGPGRGTDTIPAMLSPGEFVMNAKASRQFYSQLVGMNAGLPMGRATGGAVTNIGDINVSVKGSESGRQTGRDIATAIRRELRRGTSTLR